MLDAQVGGAGGEGYLPWLAVAGAWVCFGSFAVPMKWKSVVDAGVHPLVYQCNKTFWVFVTSHLILFFKPYQIDLGFGCLSGLSWVPAGVAAVVAVQNVGIAYGQAIWQVTIIMTSCVWGFAILQDEQVKSWLGTSAALACLALGVVGMTISFNLVASDDTQESVIESGSVTAPFTPNADGEKSPSNAATPDTDVQTGNVAGWSGVAPESRNSWPGVRPASVRTLEDGRAHSRSVGASMATSSMGASMSMSMTGSLSISGMGKIARRKSRSTIGDVRYAIDDVGPDVAAKTSVALGISAALFNGVWGGSNLVPSKYAPLHGIDFVISFATGAAIANVALIIVFVFYIKLIKGGELPSPHFRTMAFPGFISGTLWSGGNFCSLYVVNNIGQGIGNSLIQSSVICSGLWGILLYREMSGRPLIYWSFFCAVCLGGVCLLALERKTTPATTATTTMINMTMV